MELRFIPLGYYIFSTYVVEDLIKRFVKLERIPHEICICPNSVTSNRTRVGNIIKELKRVCPDVKTNIFRSVKRIKKDYLL